MGMVLVAYELRQAEGIDTAFKGRMKATYNFVDQLPATTGIYLLPDGLLIHKNATKETVSSVFKSACREVGAQWEKYFVTEFHFDDAFINNNLDVGVPGGTY